MQIIGGVVMAPKTAGLSLIAVGKGIDNFETGLINWYEQRFTNLKPLPPATQIGAQLGFQAAGYSYEDAGGMAANVNFGVDLVADFGPLAVGGIQGARRLLMPRVTPVNPWTTTAPKGYVYNAPKGFQHNLVTNPGPLAKLPGRPAANFAGGKYNTIELTEDLVLYRVGKSGGGRNAFGQWFTRKPPTSAVQARIDSAVKPQ
jgi:hypothetical protein